MAARRPHRATTLPVARLTLCLLLLSTCTEPTSAPDAPGTRDRPRTDLGEGAVILIGAGNIARCDGANDEKTAQLLRGRAGTVFTTGDNVYASATLADYESCYGPSWGTERERTRPAPGDEDYKVAGAEGYFAYFGASAGDPARGYHSWDAGAWHIVVLNSNVAMGTGSPQLLWLEADLAATAQPCVLAYWHHPRFSSYGTGVRSEVKPLWDKLHAARADVVLNGHYRVYERFAPQSPTGTADPSSGIRQFIVGTGGQGTQSGVTPRANSEMFRSNVHGVLELSLGAGSYAWEFIPVAGQTFTDAGTTPCHGRPGGPPPENRPPVADAGGPYRTEAAVTFDGSRSSDPDLSLPLTYAWNFGDGTGAAGVAPQKSYSADGVYGVSLVVTDARGLASTPATATVTVANLPPAVSAGADADAPSGVPFSLNASFGDPGGAADGPWAWSVDWGDGSPPATGTAASSGAIASSHSFGAIGTFTVRVSVTDRDGGTGTDELRVNALDPAAGVVLVGAGDIASCYYDEDEATAKLLDAIPGTVIPLGDNAYGVGTLQEYNECYGPTWGRHKARTKPVPGNHEYGSSGAPGYFAYFGAVAGDPGEGWYSYEAGEWLVLALNTGASSENRFADSPQVLWIRQQLANTSRPCTMAYMHHPHFTSSLDRWDFNWNTTEIWKALYDGGADLVIAAHDHMYERFKPMRPDGTVDPDYGIRQITAGTGGYGMNQWGTLHPNGESRNNVAHGVLKLTLRPGEYDWEFVPIAGQTFTDRGTGQCHGRPPTAPPPPPPPPVNQPPVAHPGGPYTADNTVTLSGAASSDPEGGALSYAWDFGDGTAGAGRNPVKTFAADATYTVTLRVTDPAGLESAPATTTVTIANVAPTVNAGTDASITLGDAYTLAAAFTDAGGAADAPWRWEVDWGDGSAPSTGSASSSGSPIGPTHAFSRTGDFTVRLTVTDDDAGVGADELRVAVREPGTSAVLVGAGNIARCDGANDDRTGQLLAGLAGTVFTTGDNVYATAATADYQSCFGAAWGHALGRMRPAPGDEDYKDAGAGGYFEYFGARAGTPGAGYYSYELGAWHVVVLNSNIDMSATSAQVQWLRADLAGTRQSCVLAYFHHPRFSSYGTGVRPEVKPLWDELYAARADVVLNGHYRLYERFAPQAPGGASDPKGIVQFTVGTGGQGSNSVGAGRANSVVRRSGVYGVLELTLSDGGYSWRFVTVPGQSYSAFTDAGVAACHGRPAP